MESALHICLCRYSVTNAYSHIQDSLSSASNNPIPCCCSDYCVMMAEAWGRPARRYPSPDDGSEAGAPPSNRQRRPSTSSSPPPPPPPPPQPNPAPPPPGTETTSLPLNPLSRLARSLVSTCLYRRPLPATTMADSMEGVVTAADQPTPESVEQKTIAGGCPACSVCLSPTSPTDCC